MIIHSTDDSLVQTVKAFFRGFSNNSSVTYAS